MSDIFLKSVIENSSVHLENDDIQFKIVTDVAGTSPDIQKAIWNGQHICVTDLLLYYVSGSDVGNASISSKKAGESVIKNQLKVEHFSVLKMAFVKFNCYGFPHSTIAQVTRHADSNFLVTSMRWTGEKFIQIAKNELDVKAGFYVRPPGKYKDRNGNYIEWTAEDVTDQYAWCYEACQRYAKLVERGAPYEHARELLPYCYRQPFTISGTVEALFHLLDQRTKADSEREIQILSKLLFDNFSKLAPELAEWYRDNRYGKARLAP
jgi:thymidylate synthase (FAD)